MAPGKRFCTARQTQREHSASPQFHSAPDRVRDVTKRCSKRTNSIVKSRVYGVCGVLARLVRMGHEAGQRRSGLEAEASDRVARSRIVFASLLLLACAAVAVVSSGWAGQQATVLVVPPRLAALRARLQSVEDNMMGMSGADALRAAKQAQSLQLVINNEAAVELRDQAARAPGPATLQQLAPFKVRKPAIRGSEPEISYGSAVAAGAARGPVPLDVTWNAKKKGLTAAQRLAANLASYHKGAGTPTVQGPKVPIESPAHGPSNVNPWSVVPIHPIVKRPKAHKAAVLHSAARSSGRGAKPAKPGKVTPKEGRKVLAEGREILQKGARRLLPGQKLPKGAKLLVQGKNGVFHTQTLRRVMLDGEDEAEAAGGEEEADAEGDAEGGNSTEVREEVGETGMTVEELEDFSANEKFKAKYLLQTAQSEQKKALEQLDATRTTISRGWMKHEKSDDLFADAEKHMAESTNEYSNYQRELALAKAEEEGSMAEQMKHIAETFEEDAAEKHGDYEEQLGVAPDLDLTPYVFGGSNSTNSTATAEEGEGENSEDVEAAV